MSAARGALRSGRRTRGPRWPLLASLAVVRPRPDGREGCKDMDEQRHFVLQLHHFTVAPGRFTRMLHRAPPYGNSFPHGMT